MDKYREYLDWKIDFSYFNSFSPSSIFILNCHQSPIVILQKIKVSLILKFQLNDWNTVSTFTIDDDTEVAINMFEVNDTVYKISGNGFIYRLVCVGSVNCRENDNAVFGIGSGSSDTETYIWSEVGRDLGKIVCATGTASGFAAVVGNERDRYFKIFELRDQLIVKTCRRLPDNSRPSDDWIITSLDRENLSLEFTKHLFSELTLVICNIVILSTPAGLISMFPLLLEGKHSDFVPILCENASLITIQATPCGQALVFFYNTGKVVFAIFNRETESIIYKKYFLSTDIKSAVICEGSDCSFAIVSSDGFHLTHTSFTNLNDLKFNEFNTSLSGISMLFKVNQAILACNINYCFYKITIPSNIADMVGINLHVDDIDKIGSELDKVNVDVKQINEMYYALLNEQTDSSEFTVNIVGNILSLDNLSCRKFAKDIWLVKVTSTVSERNYVKMFNLEDDLCPTSTILFPLTYFVERRCEKLNVFLVGEANSMRKLILYIGSVDIKNCISDDSQTTLSDQIKTMFINPL